MIILGIDPGFAIVGYGVLEYKNNRFTLISYGVFTTKSDMSLACRLINIEEGICEIINRYKPDAIAVEELFFNKNIKTALSAAHGRGVIMLAAARSGSNVFEYTPLQIKQAVTGYGRADKAQMQQMVKILLNLKDIPRPDDAADALAAAICHAHTSAMSTLGYGKLTTGWDHK